MSAPMDTLANLIGNSLDWVRDQPQLRQLGQGTGLAFDLATNTPTQLLQKMPSTQSEEINRK